MERWTNCVAVVTGAGSGIGKAIAIDLVTAGLKVVALDRYEDCLKSNRAELSFELQDKFYISKCDVSNEVEVRSTFKWIEESLGGTDILVNNAGISYLHKNLVDMDTDLISEIIQTNIMGVVYCTQAAFKSMKERNFNGHIIHINSIGGHRVFPLEGFSNNIYNASKYAVTAINETIRNEFRNIGTKIKTTSVSPGVVCTNILSKQMLDKVGAYLYPEDISQAVMFAISTPPHVQIHELTVRAVGEKI